MKPIDKLAIEEMRKSVQKLVGPNAKVEYIGPSPSGLRVTISVNPGYEVPAGLKKALWGEDVVVLGAAPWSHEKICFTVSGPGVPPHQECFWCDLSTNRCYPAWF